MREIAACIITLSKEKHREEELIQTLSYSFVQEGNKFQTLCGCVGFPSAFLPGTIKSSYKGTE